GPDTPVVAYVGRLASEKNIPLTFKAFLRFRELVPEAQMVFIGDGPERKKLEQTHPELHFAGMRLGEDLAEHYASADFFFFASTTETFGNVITEAMASGLAVLAYDYAAALRHIEDGVNGYKATYDDEEAYLAAVDTLVAQRKHWSGVREAAVQTAQGLSWDAILAKYEDDVAAAMQG
ncbi:MAG: glycosyltransferase, partial [Verrucomicrobiota bacterium]